MTDLDVVPATDPDVRLLVPADDEPDPELSIVIPALNESLTITDFVDWCRQGLKAADIRGEILIVDSSDDDTAELALAGGARVLKTPRRGLGRAYIDALPFIRGRYVLMGDADCTYDFRELGEFVGPFREGYEFVMGSRWKGSIEKGAMPGLHQYFGTPFTTWILNRVYGSKFSDIHCGMRGISRDALERMDISSQSWEYASEMVLKSVHMDLRTIEAPVTFLKDREGRLSHHKRSGWFSPFSAAWINLRAMFVYGADFFALKPGHGAAGARPAVHRPAGVRPGRHRQHHVLAVLDAARLDRDDPRPPERVRRRHRPGALRLLRGRGADAGPTSSATRGRSPSPAACSSPGSPSRCRWSSAT